MATLTAAQQKVYDFIVAHHTRTGGGTNNRAIGEHCGHKSTHGNGAFAIVSTLVELGLVEKLKGENGRAISNGIVPKARNAMAHAPQASNCRNGSGWSVVVVGDEVAFTLFSETGILKHDRMALPAVLAICDGFKIPADLAVVDRVATLAAKQAAKLAAKVTA